MLSKPLLVEQLEGGANHLTCAVRISASDEVDDDLIEGRIALLEESGHELRLLVRKPRQGVQNELETHVSTRANDGALENDFSSRVGLNIVDALRLLAGECAQIHEVCRSMALGRERDRLGHENPTHFEQRDHEFDPCIFVGGKRIQKRSERVEPCPLTPVRDERSCPVSRRNETEGFEAAQGRPERQPVHAKGHGELALRWKPRARSEPSPQNLPLNLVSDRVDDAKPCNRTEAGLDGEDRRPSVRACPRDASCFTGTAAGIRCSYSRHWFNHLIRNQALRKCLRTDFRISILLWFVGLKNSADAPIVDLRSDTVTKPSRGMREAMANAEVGDDVYEEDPTILALEGSMADLFTFEAALFVSSGTMGNQLAIACLTRPGDEVIVPTDAHPVLYESGAGAILSGVQLKEIGSGGEFSPGELTAAVKAPAYYAPRSSLVALENTHNRSGGRVVPRSVREDIVSRAKELGLATHLDGARIWNAEAASGEAVSSIAKGFDTVTACFSKGLGAPAGSILLGPRDLIVRARRLRKTWGGGMRQVGVLGAAAAYALQYNRTRLATDHEHAKLLATLLGETHCPTVPQTNIVQIHVGRNVSAAKVATLAAAHGVRLNPTGESELRAVTHLDVDRAGIVRSAHVLADAIEEATKASTAEQTGKP